MLGTAQELSSYILRSKEIHVEELWLADLDPVCFFS